MPIYQDLSKFLTANGVDGRTAQKVASRVQQKVQRNAQLTTEELIIVHEFIRRAPHNNYETMQLQRLVGQTPIQSTKASIFVKFEPDTAIVLDGPAALSPAMIRQHAHHIALS